jgi:hypothetical protein
MQLVLESGYAIHNLRAAAEAPAEALGAPTVTAALPDSVQTEELVDRPLNEVELDPMAEDVDNADESAVMLDPMLDHSILPKDAMRLHQLADEAVDLFQQLVDDAGTEPSMASTI